jgi:hypothetical protein
VPSKRQRYLAHAASVQTLIGKCQTQIDQTMPRRIAGGVKRKSGLRRMIWRGTKKQIPRECQAQIFLPGNASVTCGSAGILACRQDVCATFSTNN